jgi:nitrite reductase/ring-hydroxylating ferredoxin subunit
MPEEVIAEGKTFLALCVVGDVDADTPVRVPTPAMDYAVFQLGDHYFVTQDLCTHGPGSLAEGFVEGEDIECPFHQGKFNIRTGLPSAPPCSEALRIWTTHVIDGQVCIDPAEQRVGG